MTAYQRTLVWTEIGLMADRIAHNAKNFQNESQLVDEVFSLLTKVVMLRCDSKVNCTKEDVGPIYPPGTK
jgi:hypothetical protein